MKSEPSLPQARSGMRRRAQAGDLQVLPTAEPRLVEDSALDRLLHFGRSLAAASDAEAIAGLLAEALVSHDAADAVTVLLCDGSGEQRRPRP